MTPHRANHDDWFNLIPYYVNRSLAGPEREAFEHHLAGCPACRQRIEEWRWIAHTVYQDVAEWVQHTPPLSSEVRAVAQAGPVPSSNGHAALHTEGTVALRSPHARTTSRALQLPLTMAAAAVAIVVFGALLVYLATRPDESLTPGSEGQVEHAPPTTSNQPTVTPLPMYSPSGVAPTADPSSAQPMYIQAPDLGILSPTVPPPIMGTTTPANPPGIGSGGAGGAAASSAVESTRYVCQAINSTGGPTAVYQTPAGEIIGYWPTGEWLDVFQRTTSGWYQLIRSGYIWGWVSSGTIRLDGPCSSVPYPTPTNVAPPTTPNAAFANAIGTDIVLITTETIGAIPAGSRVYIRNAFFTGTEWSYHIVMVDQWYNGADAHAWQLEYESDVPPGPTPTAVFGGLGGMGFVLVTTETVGPIPAGSQVRLSHYWLDGNDYRYVIVMRDEVTVAEARAWQLAPAPEFTPGPTPTAQFGYLLGNGYTLILSETVGDLVSGSKVRLSQAHFDGFIWTYVVVAENGTTAEVREDQLYQLPMPPTPTPFVYPEATPTNVFWTFVGNGDYRFVTRGQIGEIPAETIVRIDSAWFPGDEWHYTITAQNGLSATARQSEIRYPPPEYFLTPSPTRFSSPTATPTPIVSKTPTAPVVIKRFSASPSTGAPGASITLEWETTNATGISLCPTYADVQTYNNLPASGSLTVTLPATGYTQVTYLLVASSAAGNQVTGQVTVKISESAP